MTTRIRHIDCSASGCWPALTTGDHVVSTVWDLGGNMVRAKQIWQLYTIVIKRDVHKISCYTSLWGFQHNSHRPSSPWKIQSNVCSAPSRFDTWSRERKGVYGRQSRPTKTELNGPKLSGHLPLERHIKSHNASFHPRLSIYINKLSRKLGELPEVTGVGLAAFKPGGKLIKGYKLISCGQLNVKRRLN